MTDETNNDNLDEVTVAASPAKRYRPPLPSPWKVAAVGLAGGPLVSLGLGLAQHFRNKSFLENEAYRQVRARDERDQLNSILAKEGAIADPDEQRMLEYAKGRVADGYERLAGGDPSGEQIIEHAQGLIEGIINGDIQARKQEAAKNHDMLRDLVSTSAKGYRQEYQTSVDAFNSINASAQKILDLVSDKNFDPNKPVNKAYLMDLLSQGAAMFRDTPDLMDGLTQGVTAINGIAGGIVGGIATAMKSEDFKVTPEDYNRLALNAQKYANIYANQKLSQLGSQAKQLNAWGQKVGILPADYSLSDYISGGEKELRTTPNPVFTGGYQAPPSPDEETSMRRNMRSTGTPFGNLPGRHGATGIWGQPLRPQIKPTRPTN